MNPNPLSRTDLRFTSHVLSGFSLLAALLSVPPVAGQLSVIRLSRSLALAVLTLRRFFALQSFFPSFRLPYRSRSASSPRLRSRSGVASFRLITDH